MSARELKSDFNFLLSQFSNVIRLTLPSNMLEFFVALKKSRHKKMGNRRIAFVRFSLERMGAQ